MIRSRFGWWMLAVAIAAALPLGGCGMLDDDDDDNREDQRVENRSDLPRDAQRVAQGGKGDALNYRAREDGTVYVMDRDSNRVIYSGSLRSGHQLEIDPTQGQVINNGVVVDRDVQRDNRYNIYFVPD